MTRREITELACKLMGIYFLVSSLLYVPYAIGAALRLVQSSVRSGLESQSLLESILTGLSPVLLVSAGLTLLLASRSISRLLLGADSTVIEGIRFTKLDAFRVFLPLLGFYLGIPAAGDLIRGLGDAMDHRSSSLYRTFFNEGWFWGEAIQVIASCLLIFKARPIAARVLGDPQRAFSVEPVTTPGDSTTR